MWALAAEGCYSGILHKMPLLRISHGNNRGWPAIFSENLALSLDNTLWGYGTNEMQGNSPLYRRTMSIESAQEPPSIWGSLLCSDERSGDRL